MVNSMVERATSDMLIGPDWAMNIEICDMLNREPGQAKDVVRGIKKRLGSKNPKVQLLALTLLETIIKNCGDIVHMHVAERDVLHEMVKIARKKQPDFHVKEKILILIDTWQEAFGGPRARYPQYFAAYQELLRTGAVFPQKSEAAPVFTPPQTHPLSSYPTNVRGAEPRQDAPESSAESEFPTLSLTEIQNARGIMDVLAEMLNAIDPGNKEGLKQEVIVDLVEQCRTYKQRVVHLVNSTSDESLLQKGLALNDDLQRVLAKHESIASGNPVETEKPKPESSGALVDLIDTGDSSKEQDGSAGTNSLNQLLLPAPPAANGSATPQKMDPKMDLLSGEDFSSPKAENSLALVHTGGQQSTAMPSDQNALVLMDMFSDTPNMPNPINTQGAHLGQNNTSSPQFQQQPNLQAPQSGFYANGAVPSNLASSQFDQTLYNQNSASAWNGHIPQQQPQQPTSPAAYGSPSAGALPPPPWEAQAAESSQGMGSQYPQQMPPSMGNEQSMPMYMPQVMVPGQYAVMNNHLAAQQPNQMYGAQPPQMQAGPYMGMVPPQMQGAQMAYMYPQQMYGGQYGYGQAGGQYLDQRMYGLSVRDDSGVGSPHSYNSSTTAASYLPPMKQQSKPEDKLFGDLVDMAKVKSSKPSTPHSKAGSL